MFLPRFEGFLALPSQGLTRLGVVPTIESMETTKHSPNRYPGTCANCAEWVPANAGIRYRQWPFTADQRWFVRHVDEQTCTDNLAAKAEYRRQTDLNRVRKEAQHNKWLAETEARAARYNLPKTIRFENDNYESTLTRRKTRNGYSVRWTATHKVTGEVNVDTYKFDMEAEAIIFQHETLTDPYETNRRQL